MPSIEILPDVLEYNPPLTEQSTEYATITNNSTETIAFKVKTTAPKYYCVRPNAAVVAPGETVQIQVIFLGLPEEPSFDSKCRDKFLVITLPAPHDLGDKSVAEAWSDLESGFGAQAVSKKIKVKYGHKVKPEVNDVEDEEGAETAIPVDNKKETVPEEEKETTSSNDITPTSASADLSTDNVKKSDEEEAREDSPVSPQAPSLYPPIIVAIVAVLVALIVRQYFF